MYGCDSLATLALDYVLALSHCERHDRHALIGNNLFIQT